MRHWMLTSLFALHLVACDLDATSTGGLNTIGGLVTDIGTQQPISGALVAIYTGSPPAATTLSQTGDPNYMYSTATDETGAFSLALDPGSYTVWVFAPGYRCGTSIGLGSVTNVALTPMTSSDAPPTITNAAFSPVRAIPTYPVTFTSQVSANDPNDPLSHQAFVMNPGTSLLIPLDAPGPAVDGNRWPNGAWTRQFDAPTTTGDFNMRMVVATENCACAFATVGLAVAR